MQDNNKNDQIVLRIEKVGPGEYRVTEIYDGELMTVIEPMSTNAILNAIRVYIHWRIYNPDSDPRARFML